MSKNIKEYKVISGYYEGKTLIASDDALWQRHPAWPCDHWICDEDSDYTKEHCKLIEFERKIKMENYTPEKHGIVTAIRLFYENDRQPMAELAFCFGGTDIIEWTNISQREKYSKGINGYTFFFDERQGNDFESVKR